MKLSVNDLKLTDLWVRNCATIQQVWMLQFAFGPEKFPGLLRNGLQIRFKRVKHVYRGRMHQQPRLLTRDLILCQLNQIVDTSPVNRKKAAMGDSVTSTGTLL